MRTSAKPGRIPVRYSRMGIPRRRQLSVTDKMAATLGPASGLPMWIQFFLLSKQIHSRNYVQRRIMHNAIPGVHTIFHIDGPFRRAASPGDYT